MSRRVQATRPATQKRMRLNRAGRHAPAWEKSQFRPKVFAYNRSNGLLFSGCRQVDLSRIHTQLLQAQFSHHKIRI